ncbi:MAG TPA: LamG domain-containing protein [Polyangiaceae bacterium]|nr:LamG domain-containing protein [Polyangiaceae bacterium]
MRFHVGCLAAAISSLSMGCAGDDKFATETDDEYTEPLTNAVIGTPTGVTTISATGVAQVAEAAGPKASVVIGAGGATSVAGATGVAGKASTGGSGGFGGKASTGGFGGSFGGKASTGGFGGKASAGAPSKGGAGGVGGTGNPNAGFGQWHFDDCSPTSHFLRDSSGFGANAQQELKADCVQGISGLAVNFRSAKDVVQVADQPQFTVDKHIGVAAWVNPKTVSGDQPIVLKREKNKTAFSLGVHNGNIEMSVVLSTGQTIISRAPIAANKWTHVAGMFDGTFVFLFINGQQFGQVYAAGTVREAFAPLRIGATTQNQFFNGAIDEVFVTTQTISSDVLTSLACVTRPSTLTVNPPTSGLVQPDTNVHYDVLAKNNDVGNCSAKDYQFFFGQDLPGFSLSVDNNFQSVLPGATATFGASVTGTEDADPGVHAIPFFVDAFSNGPKFDFEQLNGQLTYELAEPTGCFVRSRRELMITDVSVVDDPVRTAGSFDPGFGSGGGSGGSTGFAGGFGDAGDSGGPTPVGGSFGSGGSVGIAGSFSKGGTSGIAGGFSKGGGFATAGAGGTGPVPPPQTAGVWSFGHLMREMAPTPEQAPFMTLRLLQHWLTDQTVNGFKVAARPAMQQQLIDIWPKTSNGELDLDRSPLTLQAIVNRIDVRNLAEGSAGEGRLVYGVNGGFNFGNFTVIVEYNLVAHSQADVDDWANRWHALGSLPFPSEQYNAALEVITRRFTDRNASPGSTNGSALAELRTNEIALSGSLWELRAFALSPSTGLLAETTVKETPDLGFNNSSTFASFVNQNAAAIIAEVPGGDSHTVPLQFQGQPFMGGSVFNKQVRWNAPGINDPEARFHASLNTCNGCHGPDSGTFNFTMIQPRFPGSEATLSPFITGTTVFDPFAGKQRTLNDLGRRKTDLTSLVCTTPQLATK